MGTRRPFGPLSPYAPLRGALMGWVGHPAHMGTLWVPIIGRDLFSFLLVARPLAFGSLPAPMGTLKGAHMHTRRVCIIMGALKGTHMCTPKGCTL